MPVELPKNLYRKHVDNWEVFLSKDVELNHYGSVLTAHLCHFGMLFRIANTLAYSKKGCTPV